MDEYSNLLNFMDQLPPSQDSPLDNPDYNTQLSNLTQSADSTQLYPQTTPQIEPDRLQINQQTKLKDFIPSNPTPVNQPISGINYNQPKTMQSQIPPQIGRHDFDGLCQAFVEKVTTGHAGIYPSAITAWLQQRNKVPGTYGIKSGDPIYFAPNQSNRGFGHAGIYTGNGQFISATDSGIKTYNLNDWQRMTGQQILGYIPRK